MQAGIVGKANLLVKKAPIKPHSEPFAIMMYVLTFVCISIPVVKMFVLYISPAVVTVGEKSRFVLFLADTGAPTYARGFP
jgi:hypothetical protein